MLPRHHRLTRPFDFKRTIRAGRKASSPSVVVYGLIEGSQDSEAAARVGVTVSKAVGGSVVRHRVARGDQQIARLRPPQTRSPGDTRRNRFDGPIKADPMDRTAADVREPDRPVVPSWRFHEDAFGQHFKRMAVSWSVHPHSPIALIGACRVFASPC